MATAVRGQDATIYVDGIDASAFLNEYEIDSKADDIEVAPFNDDKYYLAGPQEHDVTLSGYWNGDSGSLDEILDDTFGSGQENVITICGGGVYSGKAAYLVSGTQVEYDVDAKSDDVTEAQADFRSSKNRGFILKDPQPVSGASGQGTEHTDAEATTRGGVGHLHVLDLGGATSVKVEIEGSADGDTWAKLIDFGTISKKGGKKVQLSKVTAVPEKLRAKWTISGGTSPLVSFVCAFGRRKR